MPFITFERGLASQRAIERIFQEQSVDVDVVMQFDNIETIKRSVEINHGVSMVPQLSVQKEVENGTLAEVGFTGKDFFRPLGIVVRRKHSLSRAAKKFIELMQNPPDNA